MSLDEKPEVVYVFYKFNFLSNPQFNKYDNKSKFTCEFHKQFNIYYSDPV